MERFSHGSRSVRRAVTYALDHCALTLAALLSELSVDLRIRLKGLGCSTCSSYRWMNVRYHNLTRSELSGRLRALFFCGRGGRQIYRIRNGKLAEMWVTSLPDGASL